MTDTPAAATEATPDHEQTQEPKPTETVDFWRNKSRDWEKRAKANAEAAARLAQLEESQKSVEERLTSRAEKAEARIPELERENARLRVALAKGLPVDLVDRLRGDTEDELAADADSLLALVKPDAPRLPAPDPSQGRTAPSTPLNGDPLLTAVKSKLGIA